LTNEQAKELAEKVWGKEAYARYDSTDPNSQYYSVGSCYLFRDSRTEIHGSGDSWESAFLAAGVKVCDNWKGYVLTEGRKP
jgi:hypothetical protein